MIKKGWGPWRVRHSAYECMYGPNVADDKGDDAGNSSPRSLALADEKLPTSKTETVRNSGSSPRSQKLSAFQLKSSCRHLFRCQVTPPSPPHEEKITFNMNFSVDAKAFNADKVAQLLKHLKSYLEEIVTSRSARSRRVALSSPAICSPMTFLTCCTRSPTVTWRHWNCRHFLRPKYAAEVLTLLKASGLLTEYEWDPFRHFRTPERLLAFFGPKTRSKARYHKSKYRPRRREPPLLIELQADRSIKIRRRPRHEDASVFRVRRRNLRRTPTGRKANSKTHLSRSNTRGRSDAFSR